MSTATHDALLPRPPGGMAPGAALAVLAHLGLLFALTAAVDWRLRTPEITASAELWAAVPQAAAPRAVEPLPAPAPAPSPAPSPPPPPPSPAAQAVPQRADADIAIERDRREKQLKAEREKEQQARELREQRAQERREQDAQKLAQKKREAAEAEAARRLADAQATKQKREADAREAKAQEARLAQQREDNLKRLLAQAGAPAGTGGPQATGSAAHDAGPSASYAGKLVALVRPNIVFTGSAEANAAAEVEVRAGPSGSIISRRLVKASGQADWDDAVLRAIDKTARLPRDTDGRIPPVIVMVFKPRD